MMHMEGSFEKLASLLKKDIKVASPLKLKKEALFTIRMENEYVTFTGKKYKQQRLDAKYRRELQQPISSDAIGTLFSWEEVVYSARGDKSVIKPLSWTFAKGLQFDYYKPFPSHGLTYTKIHNEKNSEDIGLWYPDLISTPSVNLLHLLTWDVITFEDYNSIFWRTLPQQCGQNIGIDKIEKASVPLNFKGTEEKESYFQHSSFSAKLLGYSVISNYCAALFEFQGVGLLNVHVGRKDQGSAKQEGESLYFGKIFTDLHTGDVVAGEMLEMLTVSITNRKGKIIPLQKKRTLHLTQL